RELLTRVAPNNVWVGEDFRFGKEAHAGAEELSALGKVHGFETHMFSLQRTDGEKISSSAIRRALISGDVCLAKELLGRSYSLTGEVAKSRGIGKQHGIPTANLKDPVGFRIIGDGVYRGTVTTQDGQTYRAGIFVGTPSNTSDNSRVLEAHLVGFDRDLVGEKITVTFDNRLRDVFIAQSDDQLFETIGQTVHDLAKP
ncbi:MAG: hypothetical protein FWE87_01615, partial [Coriobacteriia bacterium]|nr:hypothetical protein [Coriobacteriia bacterium]